MITVIINEGVFDESVASLREGVVQIDGSTTDVEISTAELGLGEGVSLGVRICSGSRTSRMGRLGGRGRASDGILSRGILVDRAAQVGPRDCTERISESKAIRNTCLGSGRRRDGSPRHAIDLFGTTLVTPRSLPGWRGLVEFVTVEQMAAAALAGVATTGGTAARSGVARDRRHGTDRVSLGLLGDEQIWGDEGPSADIGAAGLDVIKIAARVRRTSGLAGGANIARGIGTARSDLQRWFSSHLGGARTTGGGLLGLGIALPSFLLG